MDPLLSQDLSKLEELVMNRAKGGSHKVQDKEEERVSIARRSCGEDRSNIRREAFQLFQNIWSQAPPEWKVRFQKSTLGTVPKPPRDRLRVDLWSRATITVPEAVLTQLRLWDNDPSSFFIVEVATSSSTDPFTRLFRLLRDASGGDKAIKLIRLRLGQIGLHRLKTRLERCQLRPDTDLEKEFVNRIQFDRDTAGLKDSVKWASTGGKYDSLSKDLGGLGSMICIPTDISTAK
jgi:hypothetical protein